MAFNDEPRTNHAYLVIKLAERGLITTEEADRRILLIYPEFATANPND